MKKNIMFIKSIFIFALTLLLTGCAQTDVTENENIKPTAAVSMKQEVAREDNRVTPAPDIPDTPEQVPPPTAATLPLPTSPAGQESSKGSSDQLALSFNLSSIPAYEKEPFTIVNGNVPWFNKDELIVQSYESYSELDELGRCRTTKACIGKDIMPTKDRESIGQIKPTGWHTVKYDCVDGKYLYNRCHLIGFQLTGENANELNLITGTRYMNVDGMLPFENMVADYVKETGNHVMYRVTPIYENDDLIARGVIMEAYSVEDDGDGIQFNVFCYNVQPQIEIDYKTGESRLVDSTGKNAGQERVEAREYVLNTNTKKFHYPDCRSVASMSEKNKSIVVKTRDEIIEDGYSSCGNCKP